MSVKDGVLYFEDGREVCLWGINYYPAHSNNYVNLKELGLDHKKVMDEDFEHFAKMGIDVIRVHLFDREISDKEGRLLDNEHLDLTDYLISKCHQYGIYFVITPIAWWNSMALTKKIEDDYAFWWMDNEQPLGFSNYYSKEALLWNDDAIKAQEIFLHGIAAHKNRYTGKTYGEDPTACIWEIINEPCYRTYREMKKGRKRSKGGDFQWADERENLLFKNKYLAWLGEKNLPDSEESYFSFRYSFVKDYIDRMAQVIRDAGVKQPIAYCLDPDFFADHKNPDDIMEAVADSKVEVMTLAKYFGSGSLKPLEQMSADQALNFKNLRNKARIVYEFGDSNNLNSAVYPAVARLFRSRGVQIATMFQYDPRPIAEYNTGWCSFYLNYLYTPQKAVSFMIAREVFHKIARGSLPACGDDIQEFDQFAVSFKDNISVMRSETEFMHSNTLPGVKLGLAGDRPGRSLKRIIGYGKSALIDYDGAGLYRVEILDDMLKVEILPDAQMLSDPWHADPLLAFPNRYMDIRKTAPVAKLERKHHTLRINLPGWQKAKVWRIDKDKRLPVECQFPVIPVQPGYYEIDRINI